LEKELVRKPAVKAALLYLSDTGIIVGCFASCLAEDELMDEQTHDVKS